MIKLKQKLIKFYKLEPDEFEKTGSACEFLIHYRSKLRVK